MANEVRTSATRIEALNDATAMTVRVNGAIARKGIGLLTVKIDLDSGEIGLVMTATGLATLVIDRRVTGLRTVRIGPGSGGIGHGMTATVLAILVIGHRGIDLRTIATAHATTVTDHGTTATVPTARPATDLLLIETVRTTDSEVGETGRGTTAIVHEITATVPTARPATALHLTEISVRPMGSEAGEIDRATMATVLVISVTARTAHPETALHSIEIARMTVNETGEIDRATMATGPTDRRVTDRLSIATNDRMMASGVGETDRAMMGTDRIVRRTSTEIARHGRTGIGLLTVSRDRHFPDLQSQTGQISGQRIREMDLEGRIKVVRHPDPEGLVPTGQNANLKVNKSGGGSVPGDVFRA